MQEVEHQSRPLEGPTVGALGDAWSTDRQTDPRVGRQPLGYADQGQALHFS